MSYTPTNWKAGDTVTSAKLNKIEQGIAQNKHPIIRISKDEEENYKTISTITYDEFITYLQNNILPVVIVTTEDDYILEIYYLSHTVMYDDTYCLIFSNKELAAIFELVVEPESGLIIMDGETQQNEVT